MRHFTPDWRKTPQSTPLLRCACSCRGPVAAQGAWAGVMAYSLPMCLPGDLQAFTSGQEDHGLEDDGSGRGDSTPHESSSDGRGGGSPPDHLPWSSIQVGT